MVSVAVVRGLLLNVTPVSVPAGVVTGSSPRRPFAPAAAVTVKLSALPLQEIDR